MDYRTLEKFLEKKIENAQVEIIGKSVLGRFIYSVYFDFGSNYNIIIHASIHAREHITTDLVCRLIQDISKYYEKYKTMQTPNIIFVPMVNPDGVELCYYGLKSVQSREKRGFLTRINAGKDFSLFKANANGVDLNTNFDAKWGSGKGNKFFASADGFIGHTPMSEPEVQALALLTCRLKPFFTISYHCKGQEIYYQFFNKKENIRRDKNIAKIIAKSTKYKIKDIQCVSSGGYKDWCVQRFGIPSVTIEVGKDELIHPLSINHLPQIYKRNKNIIKCLNRIQKEYVNGEKRKQKIYGRGDKAG